MGKPQDPSRCTFCIGKPRRSASGICSYILVQKLNLGTFKHQKIQTTTKTFNLPICDQCGRGFKACTSTYIICGIVVLLTVVVLAFFVGPVDKAAGEKLRPSHIAGMSVIILACIAPFVLIHYFRWQFGFCKIVLPVFPDGSRSKEQRRDALKSAKGYGSLRTIPELRRLVIEESYSTSNLFAIFIGGYVKLNG